MTTTQPCYSQQAFGPHGTPVTVDRYLFRTARLDTMEKAEADIAR